MNRIRIAAAMLAAAAGLMPGAALAEDGAGGGRWYVAAGGTLSALDDIEQTIANVGAPGIAPFTLSTVSKQETGYGGYAALGRDFGRVRLEVEVGFTANPSDSYFAGPPFNYSVAQDADTDVWRYMANAYYDFGDEAWAVQPYVGAGIGAASVSFYRFNARAPFPTEPPRRLIDDKDTGFAWQVMGGASVRASDSVSLVAQLRWFDAGTLDIVDVRNEAVTMRVRGLQVDIGLRIAF